MIIGDDIVVRIIDMPHSIKGFCSPSPDGVYNVYLNARQSREAQEEALRHEMKHIMENDFESDEPVGGLESNETKAKIKCFG